MSPGGFVVSLVVAVGVGAVGFFIGWRGLHRARLIEDVATARVRSAHQGYVELSGRAQVMDGPSIIAPLSMTPCCWYRFKVEERDNREWNTTRSGTSDDLFLIDDETGQCVIDPDHAEVIAAHKAVWYGSRGDISTPGVHADVLRPQSRWEGVLHGGANVLSAAAVVGDGYRFTEEVILPGDDLYAVGFFRSVDDIDHGRHREEMTRQILADWKSNQATLKARFDHNRDDQIDVEEWEDARRAATKAAAEAYQEQIERTHLHLLSRPEDGRPYLLSNLSQHDLSRRFRMRGWLGLAAFLIAGSVVTYLIKTRWPFG